MTVALTGCMLGDDAQARTTELEPTRGATATFAGGCFWCVESAFDETPGVLRAISGYTGGAEVSPSYRQVASGKTRHREAVQVTFDPARITYRELLDIFWRQIDPTDRGGQFADRGHQYTTAIFYHDAMQKKEAQASKLHLTRSGRFKQPIVTPLLPARPFYQAEDDHQDYHHKNPLRYRAYRAGSGRTGYLLRIWGAEHAPAKQARAAPARSYSRPGDAELRRRLTSLQYEVTQRDGTEPPFRNRYWDNKAAGIYVDVVSGEPLFSSRDKFKSGTGWPSFSRPLEPGNIVARRDRKLLMARTEVRSKHGGSHLGHVFRDGPAPTGLRYCINSAALRFVPRYQLEREGYGSYLRLFEGRAEAAAVK